MLIIKKIGLGIINHKSLIIILVLAAILRLWYLGSIPPGLTPDEAALGYNAYSILHTGRDEFGKFLPIIFKSFGDYKPGFYIYLTVPSVAILGLSEFSTRLPSALAGIISVFLIYLITKKLFSSMETGKWKLETLTALVAAINPYLIYFSRGAWEANISLTLTLAGIYFFLRAVEDSKYLVLSTLYFALTLVTYQGAKLSTAIVLVLLVAIYWKDFWKIKLNYLIVSLGLGIIVSIPIILTLFNGQAQRLTIFSVFSYPRLQSEIQTYSDGYFGLFHSNQLNYLRMIISRWLNFYSGQFLVFEGDAANPVHTAPYQGVLLLVDIIFLPIGLFFLFKSKIVNRKSLFFIFFWLILAPFSAAISRDQTNAVRSLNAVVPLIIIISFGLLELIRWLNGFNDKWLKVFGYSVFLIFYLLSFIYFLDAYFIHVPAHNSNFWRYGYKEVFDTIIPLESKYKDIIVEQSFNQPYIYFLFYQAMENPNTFDAVRYQKQEKLVNSQYIGDVGFIEKLDNIQFKVVDLSALRFLHGALVASSPVGLPPEWSPDKNNFILIKEIKYLNNRDTAFKIVESK